MEDILAPFCFKTYGTYAGEINLIPKQDQSDAPSLKKL